MKELIEWFGNNEFPDLKKIIKIIKNINLSEEKLENQTKFYEKVIFQIYMDFSEIVIKYFSKSEKKLLKVEEQNIEEFYLFFIDNIYLQKYKMQKNRLWQKISFKKLKFISYCLREITSETLWIKLQEQTLDLFIKFIKKSKHSNFQIFHEIRSILKGLFK